MRSGLVLVAAAMAGCGESALQPRDGTVTPSDGAAVDQVAETPASRATPPADPGRIGIHFLNKTEYDNTVRDLLAVPESPVDSLPPDDVFGGFDNNAELQGGMSPSRYERFFAAARQLSAQVFASESLRGRILTCTPPSTPEDACVREIIRGFGLRAWRRPLTDPEVERLFALAGVARGSGDDFLAAMQRVVTAMLSSVPFLYHVELDPQPTSQAVHPLTGYELAARLSYLLWRTMPDERLFALAASGELGQVDVLLAQAERMLADPRSVALVRALADNWWDARSLRDEVFDLALFPSWDDELQKAIGEEVVLYLSEFLQPNRSFLEVLTADMNFVNARLARHYGFPAPAVPGFARVVEPGDQRRGYLGLAAFLAGNSPPDRTSPTRRGIQVLESVLCYSLPPPPPDVPALPLYSSPARTPRQLMEQIGAEATCASCHKIMDPIGLGLETFDATGAQRTVYPNGEAVDVSGLVFEGQRFNGPLELADLLARDPRFVRCPPKKLFTYALRRLPEDQNDQLVVEQLTSDWSRQGSTLRGLIKQIVASAAFRFRRGEAN